MEQSVSLAYLIGVVAGDGCISKCPRTERLEISCDTKYPWLVDKYTNLIKTIFSKEPSIREEKGKNMVRVGIYKNDISETTGLPTGNKGTNGFTVPEWIFSDREYTKAFVLGMLETDGSVNKTYHNGGWSWQASFTQKNTNIMSAFLRAVEILGYQFKVGRKFAVRLSKASEVKRLIEDIGITKIGVYEYK